MRKAITVFRLFLLLISLLFLITSMVNAGDEDAAKNWLREVEPIITKAERTVFKGLKTAEDRARFINYFWRVRDPKPETPQNEYKIEYYKRLNYVKTHFQGLRSDRGRIYMILGKPIEVNNYSGLSSVVDCELWTYYAEGRPGLPPVIHLIFYKRENYGDYRLFYPGIDTALDILSPGYREGYTSARSAYRELRKTYAELADATLSVIPGEGSPYMPSTATSSNHVFAQIFSLPEREMSDSYLQAFRLIQGTVDVTYSFREMSGSVSIGLTKNKGYTFLNYSIVPDTIRLKKVADNLNYAQLNLNLRIENLDGKTIFQKERNVEIRLDDQKKGVLDKKKIMISDFVPVINGEFNVSLILSNKSTKEFLIHREKLEINKELVPVLCGFEAVEIQSDRFMPFTVDNYKISVDPRFVFNKTETLVGIVMAEQKPDIRLIRADNEEESFVVKDIIKIGRYFLFKKPLADLKSSNYYLSISTQKGEVYRKIVAVLPFLAERAQSFEWTEASGSTSAYNFEIATQYLNNDQIQKAIEYFNRVPKSMWNAKTIPSIAQAYYRAQDYEKVVELLEREEVPKNYSTLLLLGNSCLELKQLEKAADYFEKLRNYGDTSKINRILGAISLSLGRREEARVYFNRAKDLENKIKDKSW